MSKVKLNIDGKDVEVEKGATVLEAARRAGIEIPTICDHKDLPHYGACRMCIVEIDKVRGYPTSCTTPAEDGMVVKTQTDELKKQRSRILELMLSGHPNSCLLCPHRELCEKYRPRPTKAGRTTRCGFCSNRETCTLRDLTFKLQPDYGLSLRTLYSEHNVEKYDPFMDRDYNLCILCGRCWRMCEKIHGKPAISIVNRGRWARPGTNFDKSYVDSGCTFCGACIDICPTGTLADRYARWYGEPDREVESTCTVCPQGCGFVATSRDGKMVAARMKNFNPESRLCAIGRFAYVQMANTPDRLLRPVAVKDGDQVPLGWEEAVKRAAEELGAHKGAAAVIAGECESREIKNLYARVAKEALGGEVGWIPAGRGFEDIKPQSLKKDVESGKIKALVMAGNYLPEDLIEKIETLVVIDWRGSTAAGRARVVLPVSVLSETEGTFRTAGGDIRTLTPTSQAPGEAMPEWKVICDLGRAMGTSGFDISSIDKAAPKDDPAPDPLPGAPRDRLADVPALFRGHYIADTVCALESIGLPVSPPSPVTEPPGGFLVREKREVIPNFHELVIEAPQVAKFALPGQFVIVMVKQTSERIPYTLSDWDPEEGTITMVVEEVGRSSREVARVKAGERLAHVTGPLGLPMEIDKPGTVVLGGGCFGIGAIYPIARAMKEAGARVISVIEASSHYLLYWEEKLKKVSDQVLVATKDGSRGTWGGVQEVFLDLLDRGEKIDLFMAIGCTFMMRMVSEATQGKGVPTYVALNPIMVDGTGMCGACRVSIAGETRFACVDGPIFNGHEVDWDELFSRRGAYATLEIESLPQGTALELAREKLEGGRECTGACHEK